jgi:acetyl-CoA carboxylase carboxyl transferase beta subunit
MSHVGSARGGRPELAPARPLTAGPLEVPSEPVAARPRDIALPNACPTCGMVLEAEAMRQAFFVCSCGRHFRMSVEAWIELLACPGTWRERWDELRCRDPLGWKEPKAYASIIRDARLSGLNEAVRAGTCQLDRHPVVLCVFDFRFLGGTLGQVAGERLARGIEHAHDERMPFVLVSASGGARMQEGVLALVQMAKVNAAVTRLQTSPVPFLSVLTDPTFGGTAASLALLADVNIAEPEAAIGFTGARVIKQATHCELPAGFQSAEFQLAHGQIDMVVHRHDLRAELAHLLDLYTARGRP